MSLKNMTVTLVLVAVLSVVIVRDYTKVKSTLWADLGKIGKGVDPAKVRIKATSTSLDTYRPDSFEILVKLSSAPAMRPDDLKEAVNYYEKIIRYRPYQMEAYILLGFSYYYSGRVEEAAAVYQAAIQLNPAFFWAYYNLGAIHFNQKNFKEAAEYFKRAVATDPRETLRVMLQSHIYMEVLSREKEVRDSVGSSLSLHYQKAYEALLLSENKRLVQPLAVRFF